MIILVMCYSVVDWPFISFGNLAYCARLSR